MSQDRALYREAVEHLRTGNRHAFKRTAAKLTHYELHPYLTYHYLNARLALASPDEVTSFVKAEPRIPVQALLHNRWLMKIGQQRKWQLFADEFVYPANATLNCYHLRALYGTGQQDLALRQTTSAWSQPSSQPKACDPIFEVWRKSAYFTAEVAWQRFADSLAANEVTLARYLQRFLQKDKAVAELFYQAHVRPKRILQTHRYGKSSAKHRQVIAYALPRLTKVRPKEGLEAWEVYKKLLPFSETEQQAILVRVWQAAARGGHFPDSAVRAAVTDPELILELQQFAVRHQRWDEVIYWSERLTQPQLGQPKVQYWLARALELSTGDLERARLALRALANTRHYYGFWAAQHLGIPGQLNANPIYDQRTATTRLSNNPRFSRSLELFAVGDDVNGRREWYAGLAELDVFEQHVAAELALATGLLTLAINTANHSKARNALHLRFPVAYLPQFRQAALDTKLAVPTLMAVSRQESAWNHRAASSANARGLMQLLPSTARLAARRQHLRSPTTAQLFDPTTNITLGSTHLAWLLKRYDGQLTLAFAAYNAGEHRVDRWLRERRNMPLDVWIETIPYRETRNYVKNALAFRQVYAQLAHSPLPFVSQSELVVRAP